MKTLKTTGLVLLILLVGIQFFPTNNNQNKDITNTDFMVMYKVPKAVEDNLKKSCYDCHSNYTQYPWYNKIQPISWFLEKHIKEGKAELNFNEFGNLSTRRKRSKLKSIVNEIKDEKMPISSYTFIHKDAQLSKGDRDQIENYILQLIDSINN